MSNEAVSSILGAYASIPARDRECTEVWMSRETLTMCMDSVSKIVSILPTLTSMMTVTLVGMRVMIDDRMPDGIINFERRNVAVIKRDGVRNE